uniref:Uncharacterized protein n=1 Tax=Avena sativa TaxID=4498 RepID=A0ACD5UJQ2_AVESA
MDVAEAEVNRIEKEARLRHEALYNKAMRLYVVLASPEERARMADPIGWRPVLNPNVNMEEHVCRLQKRVNAELIEEAAPAPTSQTTTAAPASTPTTVGVMANSAFKSLGDVLMVLPTSTVIVYEVLNPIVTSAGECSVANKAVTAVLVALCAFSCAFSAFTDSYIGADGKVRYGIVTPRGLLPFNAGDDPHADERDFSKYRLRLADFAHALFSVIVFAAVALLADANTVACFYPRLIAQQKALVTALPVVIGALASGFFVVFPSTRHGIGYPPMKPAATALAEQ